MPRKPKPRKPYIGIEAFTGEASEWLTYYMENTKVDPEKQAEVDRQIRKSASRCVEG